jgi:hypothetical protein
VRFARFVHAGGVSFGVVEGDGSSGLTVAEIDSLPFEKVRFTGQRWALADIRLLAPIFSSKVIGIGRNYAEHAAELGNQVPAEPLIFIKPSTSVIGPNDAIRIPPQSQQVEEEAELAVVIGATGARRVDRAGAQKASTRSARSARGSSPTSTSATSRSAARSAATPTRWRCASSAGPRTWSSTCPPWCRTSPT